MTNSAIKRIWAAWAASLLAGTVIAGIDAAFAARAQGSGVAVPWKTLALAIVSLNAVYSLAIAVGVAFAVWALRTDEDKDRTTAVTPANAWFWPIAALLGLCWLLLSAQVTQRLLVSSLLPNRVGALASVLAIALAAVCFGVALALASATQRRFGEPLTSRTAAGVAALILGAGLAALVAIGETSGAGGAFGMFGVLRRQELDLRGVGLLLTWCGGGWALFALGLVATKSLLRSSLIIVGTLGLAGYGYRTWIDDDAVLTVRSAAPLGGNELGPLWKVLDFDGDGQSAAFGGLDCDDGNAQVYVGAQDQPANEIDEDCNGYDEAWESPPKGVDPPQPKRDLSALRKDLNLLLLTVDTMRFDLGYMGNPRPLSKNLDQLAARSVVFDRAYSLASYTGKALGPMMIGRYPGENHRTFGHFDRFSRENTFIQERLQRAGMHTVSVQGYWYFVDERTGLNRGFDVVDQSAKPPQVDIEGDATVNSDKISDAALKQLQALPTGKRFFMWAHYVDPHADYVPHKGFEFGRKGRELYDGEIGFVDQQLGRILDFVQQGPLNENTVIVVTSDHGEAFGEHDFYRHGFELWEELIRVPLIIHVPGIAAKREQVRRSAIDLVPTLLELMQVPLPGVDAPDWLSGQSLVTDLLRTPNEPAVARPIFADLCAGPFNDERQALIEDDQKIITAMGRPVGLYDLSQDAGEKNNLIKDEPRAAAMKAKLASFRSRLKVVQPTREAR